MVALFRDTLEIAAADEHGRLSGLVR